MLYVFFYNYIDKLTKINNFICITVLPDKLYLMLRIPSKLFNYKFENQNVVYSQ